MRTRPKQNGDLAQGNTPVTQVRNALRNVPRLLVFIVGADNNRLLISIDPREESFLVTLLNLVHQGIRHIKNWLRAAIVLLQLDDLRRRKQLRKLQHVFMAGAAEGIDRLKLVTNYRDIF